MDQEPFIYGMDRQIYKDRNIVDARAAGCDVVQLKFDGWWSSVRINDGVVEFYTRTGRLFKTMTIEDKGLQCELGCEHMQGTQWAQAPERIGRTFIFDAWRFGNLLLDTLTYRERYRLAVLIRNRLPESFIMVNNYPIDRAEDLWHKHVDNDGEYEGLVFRNSADKIASVLYRHKKTITEDYMCLGFVEGVGKFQGTLGAVLIGDDKGNPILTDGGEQASVSGGTMTDEDRAEVWNNQPFYLNKPFECEGKARFKSGCLRHPNFIRWRMDKLEP